jgi:hypothetical protein
MSVSWTAEVVQVGILPDQTFFERIENSLIKAGLNHALQSHHEDCGSPQSDENQFDKPTI